MTLNINKFLEKEDITVKQAMRKFGEIAEKFFFIVSDDNKLLGSLTDGDIRRWVLKGGNLSSKVSKVYNKKPISFPENYDIEEVKKFMIKEKIQSIPVIDKNNNVKEILLWDVIFGKEIVRPLDKISLPVVIMAGGKGSRLDPFTKVLPKPLIPIGDKTILEIIMEKFNKFGINEFYISINYKSHMIKAYFQESNPKYKIHYIEEKMPLGTTGSLSLIKSKIKSSVFVSNCDIIIDSDYHEIVKFHQDKDNDITLVGSFRHFVIPYGVCEIQDGGSLVGIKEKPEYDFLVNTGMYIIKKEALKHIPTNKEFSIIDLVNVIKKTKGKVGVFPLEEKSWIDVGQWEEFHSSLKKMNLD